MRIKKRRGIFYTPSNLAEAISAWTIRSANDVALEPSFGGCGFISALAARLFALGNEFPLNNIFGCDVDSAAFKRHLPSVGAANYYGHFIKADFLSISPRDFGRRRFTAIAGNPPYVAYHNMYRTQRKAAAAIRSDEYFRVSGTASLWAYFVFHALRFLEIGGRMAWVLPGSLIYSDYAKRLLNELAMRFANVRVISLAERVFAGAGVAETTEVLLCDTLRATRESASIQVVSAKDVKVCAELLKNWTAAQGMAHALNRRVVPALIGDSGLAAFSEVARNIQVTSLGALADVKIGIVTGANRLFVIDDKTAARHNLPAIARRPILAKLSVAPGISVTQSDLKRAREGNARCLFIDRRKAPYSKRIQMYFAAFPKAARLRNVTFKKYSDWRCPDDDNLADAFFPYMHHTGPRLVLNSARINATNTIHRVYFNKHIPKTTQQLAALSMLSTFSQISAELEGRSYGGGVLKHEPNEARRVSLIMPHGVQGLERVLSQVDALLREGLDETARHLVDLTLMRAMIDAPSYDVWQALSETLLKLRRRRQRKNDAPYTCGNP
jgi:hypothetical protein